MNVTNKQVAEALYRLDQVLLDMGDCYQDTVDYLCTLLDEEFIYDPDDLKDAAEKLYEKILDNCSPEVFKEFVTYYEERIDTFIYQLGCYAGEDVTKIEEHCIYKDLQVLYEFAKKYPEHNAEQGLQSMISTISEIDIMAVNVGYRVAHCYFKYLDSNVFGLITNDFFTVGHVLASGDEGIYRRNNDYLFRKDIRLLSVNRDGYAVFVGHESDGSVSFNICEYIRKGYEYIYTEPITRFMYKETMIDNGIIEELAKKIAECLNRLGALKRCDDEPLRCKAWILDTLIRKMKEQKGEVEVLRELKPYWFDEKDAELLSFSSEAIKEVFNV